ncbi:hypothetical protein DQ04_19511000 [Trypanosoma grayi]|uniref:hypothetical protein n=1 Tax=Trypanosoma grayi TaxID=71804 RepID=UPI0004F452DE|nr:hypothetical protein DQ04_19511000 [Trypanosoma grayi]KEG05667.1 hypothetical protein DQ04_19511000 [Trypanosoma grayi]
MKCNKDVGSGLAAETGSDSALHTETCKPDEETVVEDLTKCKNAVDGDQKEDITPKDILSVPNNGSCDVPDNKDACKTSSGLNEPLAEPEVDLQETMDLSKQDPVSVGPCADGAPAPCPKNAPKGPGGPGAGGNTQDSSAPPRCQSPQVLSDDRLKCVDDASAAKAAPFPPPPAPPPPPPPGQPPSHPETQVTGGTEENGKKELAEISVGGNEHEKGLNRVDKKDGNSGPGVLPKHREQGGPRDKQIGEGDQAAGVGESSNVSTDAHRPVGAKNDTPISGPTPPAPPVHEAESLADDNRNGEPAESTPQAAVEQGDAVQSQTSPASTSTSATEATGSSSQPTDKGQDPKATDSSSGPVWVHAPPLLLPLSVMWLGGLAVTAAC